MSETPAVSPATRRNRQFLARRQRGAVIIQVVLEQPHIARLIARRLLDKRSDADREAIAAAVLALISEDPPPVDTGIARPPDQPAVKLAPYSYPAPLAGPLGNLEVPPNFKPIRYPMWVNGRTVNNEAEELAARTAPPQQPTPKPMSDWDKSSAAFENQTRESAERLAQKAIDDALFLVKR